MEIYCGNNRFEIGDRRLGTRYQCLRKGVGYGLHADLNDFQPEYEPIVPNNKYCGNGAPPPGKILGTPGDCLRKGIGIGKKLQYERSGRSERE